jgi:hypothetical protein
MQCRGKHRYINELDAMMALASCRAHTRRNGKRHVFEARYYLCPECNGYHLTHHKTFNGVSVPEPDVTGTVMELAKRFGLTEKEE